MSLPLAPLDIFGGSFTDETKAFDLQDCVNFLPEPAEDPKARAKGVLRGCPGLRLFKALGGSFGSRGWHNCEGTLFVVNGTTLYEIQPDSSAVSRGTVPGSGPVDMEHNQIAGGNEVVIFTGSDGFVWNTYAKTFTQITDDAFPGAFSAGYIDSYICAVEPLGRYWFTSDLANATSYDDTNRYSAESAPDGILGLLVSHSEVWVFGQRTIEHFQDTGSNDIAFQPNKGTVIEKGVAGRYCFARMDNTVYWLGNDGIVYSAGSGYAPTRVSTHAIEQAIDGLNLASAKAFVWIDRGHSVFYLDFPDGHTWGFDVSSGLWHRRESHGLTRWRVNDAIYWNGGWYGTDFANGNIYHLDWDEYTENGAPLVAMRRTSYLSSNQNRVKNAALEIVMDTGRGPVDGDSCVNLRYSDDNGYTWSNYRQISLEDINNRGYRVRFTRLGSFYQRVYEIMVSSNVKRDIISASGAFA